MKRRLVGLDATRAAGLHLVKVFGRIEKIHARIDAAYAGEPFLPDLPPDEPLNGHRFNSYVDAHTRVTKLLGRAIELWMVVFGMKKRR